MKKLSAMLLMLLAVLLLVSCDTGSTEPSENEDGYTVSIQITNIPEGLNGNAIEIVVLERTNSYGRTGTGIITSTIKGTSFNSAIKEYNLSSGITDKDKLYSGTVELSFEINIDVNGNAIMNDVDFDISDATSCENITFSKKTTYTIDYNSLHVCG